MDNIEILILSYRNFKHIFYVKYDKFYLLKNFNLVIFSTRKRLYKIFEKRRNIFYWTRVNWFVYVNAINHYNRFKIDRTFYTLTKNFQIRHLRIWSYFKEKYFFENEFFNEFFIFKWIKILQLFQTYYFLFFQVFTEKHYWIKTRKNKNEHPLFRMIFSFYQSKMFITFHDDKNYNFIFMSSGFLIKFFKKKKSFKKNKIIKILLARYLRKLCLISNLLKIYLFIKRSPIFLIEMLKTLNQRIGHPFWDPTENEAYDETSRKKKLKLIKIPVIFFMKSKFFGIYKFKNIGRIKRKIRRKLIAINRHTD